jgi:short-subunit dehydrogenase
MGTYLVTGASSGIGEAVARRLRDRGDGLVLTARHRRRAEELRAEFPDSTLLVVDLEEAEHLEPGRLPDVLAGVVHAAGVVNVASLGDTEPEWLWRTVNVNLMAPMLLTRALLEPVRRGRGTHVFVNSGSGLRASPRWAAYSASKFGLRGFADSLRAEEAEHGVRVTSIYPGRTATPMQELVHQQEGADYDPTAWTSPETVAEAILGVLDLNEDATVPDLTIRPGASAS